MSHFVDLITQAPFMVQILGIFGSVLGLWYGAEKAIWGVKNFARKFQVPELLIGLSIVSIGSSLPEIFVNITAGIKGVDDIGVGNIVGSCFVQISCILGICVLIGGAMYEQRKKLKRDAPLLLGSIILVFLFGLDGEISLWEGLFMMGIYITYLAYLFRIYKKKAIKRPHKKEARSHVFWWIVAFMGGVSLIYVSAEILIGIGIHFGEAHGIDESVIGLFSGIGTSIPELTISLMALLRKSNGISVGNLLGSNITDPLFSLGIGASLAHGYTVSNFLLYTAIPVWFFASFSTVMIFWFFGKMTRVPALLLVAFYIGSFFLFFL